MSPSQPQWLIYAALSGACAALNGVFAKLVTTTLTTSWATNISRLLGQTEPGWLVEVSTRVAFFLLNLTFNAVMWALFTRALTLANSTVRVSVINTSTNFVITALMGAMVFGEDLPGLWWVGAGLLVAGSVIIGRREEASPEADVGREGSEQELKFRREAHSVSSSDSLGFEPLRKRKPRQ